MKKKLVLYKKTQEKVQQFPKILVRTLEGNMPSINSLTRKLYTMHKYSHTEEDRDRSAMKNSMRRKQKQDTCSAGEGSYPRSG